MENRELLIDEFLFSADKTKLKLPFPKLLLGTRHSISDGTAVYRKFAMHRNLCKQKTNRICKDNDRFCNLWLSG